MTELGLRWTADQAGDCLWLGDDFLGCTYNRDTHGGRSRTHGWRVLAGEDLVVVGDAVPTRAEPNPRIAARRLLEAHVGGVLPLPTAQQLLAATAQEGP